MASLYIPYQAAREGIPPPNNAKISNFLAAAVHKGTKDGDVVFVVRAGKKKDYECMGNLWLFITLNSLMRHTLHSVQSN